MGKVLTRAPSLRDLRRSIDALDNRLLRLMNRRARLASRIGDVKRRRGDPMMDPRREAFVLRRIVERNSGPLPDKALHCMFAALMRECRRLEEQDAVAAKWEKALGSPTISIIGLGLIGGSLARAIKSRSSRCKVIGWDIHKTRQARELVDHFTTNPKKALEADIVILAMPIVAIIRFLRRYRGAFRPGALVLDVGSTKRRVCAVAKAVLPKSVFFIGGHPLAGKAVSGTANAAADLFENWPFVLVPGPANGAAREKLDMAKVLASGIGAIPVVMDAATHDKVLAATSHLPQMASVAMTLAAEKSLTRRRPVSGPTFREMTRLALSDYGLWREIVATNGDFITGAMAAHQRTFAGLARAVRKGQFAKEFKRAKQFRKRLLLEGLC